MERNRSGFVSRVPIFFCVNLGIAITLAWAVAAPAQLTNLAVTARHAPNLNGNGRIEGSVQQLLGENVTLNGGCTLTGDLLVPGTPTLRVNGNPIFAGTIVGTGSASPTGYQVTLNGNCSLHYLRTRTTPVSLPTVSAPPAPTGTRTVAINSVGQSIGDPATLRNLTLNGIVGMVSVPPGTYGNFTVNGGSGLVIGVAGGKQAVNYNMQNLNLNGNSTLKVVGPVVLTVANGFTANGSVGASNNPAWLQLRAASGGFTLNGGCTVYGLVTAPSGMVIVNGNSTLVGTSASDEFILNGGGLVRWSGSSTQTNQLPPVATNQTITLAENSSTNITLAGFDPQGLTLTFSVLTQPTHGTLSGTPPGVNYRPATNYFGGDAFTFKVNNGVTDSAPATISLMVTQVYYPPVAYAQSLTNFEDTALPVTLTGSDPEGYALTCSVLTPPAHGTLSGKAPSLTYLPVTNYFGNDAFTFRVNDGVSNSAPATISITNQPVDDPPIVVAGPNQIIILPTNTVSLTGSVTYDTSPGTVDTVLWSNVSGPGNVTFSNPSNPMTLATFSTNGIYRLRLFASDSFLSGSNDLFVTVDAPPVVNAGLSTTNTFPGTITLSGTASDDGLPTDGTLTVLWSKVSGPGTVVFGNPAATNSTATFSTNGIYVLRLTADDSIATNHADITIIENLPPVVNAGANVLTNGLQAVLNGSVIDDELPGGFLSVQWSQSGGPGNVTFGNAQATNTAVTASQSGTYILALTAFDGAATNSSEAVVTFNLPPAVNAGPAQMVNFGATVTLAGTVTDDQLPHNILTSTWTVASGPGNVTFADATLTNTTVTFDQPGIYTLRLTASDTLATTNADVVIKVNGAPVVNAGANQLVTLSSLVILAGSFTDDGISGLPVTAAWTQISGPAGAVIAAPAATNTTVSFSQAGVYVFQLTASDGVSSNSGTVIITVDATANALQLNVPGEQDVFQDAPLVFEDERRIMIRGGGAGSEQLVLSLSVSNGILTIGSTNGLIVSSGTDGTSNLVVVGSEADLNAALDGLTYLGDSFFVGADTVVLAVKKLTDTGWGDSKDVPITVLPILTFVGPLTGAVEQVPFVITYDDLYWNSDIGIGVSFRVESLTSGALTKNGQPLEYETDFISPGESVVWTSPSNAIGQVEAFQVVAWDGSHQSSNAVPVYVEVHPPMHLNVPGEQIIPHNMALVFGAGRLISIMDEDPGLGELELSLSVSGGTLTLGSGNGLEWQAGANGTSAQVVRGTLADLNTALAGLTYLNSSSFSGTDFLNLAVDDLGNNDLGVDFKDAKTIPIAVLAPRNNPPKVSIVAPADTSQFQSGQTIAVEAAAVDLDGQVTNVTLLADGLELAELAAPPFATAWTGAALGRHVLSAVATDDRGATAVSTDVSIWVVDENGDFMVEAGPDQIISLPNAAALAGMVEIQTPVPESQTNVTWSKLDGPGDVQFSDPNALATTAQFSEAGSYVLKLQAAYAGGIRSDLLKVDVLPVPPDRLTAARSTKGTDFWLTFLANLQPYMEPPYEGCDLYISADVDTVVQVNKLYEGTEQPFQIRAGSSIRVPTDFPIDFAASDSIRANAIHVTADHPVTVHGLNYLTYSTDGYLALPTAMLGTDYIILAYQNSPSWHDPEQIDGGTEFALVASEDDTHVIITPSATTDSRIAGVPYEIILQQGETYRLINYDGPDADFTGTTIISDKPVAVFGGHVCALIPPSTPAGDHLVEELPPVDTWGRHFVTMPLATRTKGDTFRFLAATNGTRLAINGKIVASLDRGQFYEQIFDGPAEILASQPILTAQYANGSDFDGTTGDPFMMLIPPFEQFGGDYILSTAQGVVRLGNPPSEVYTNNYVNLTVRTNGVGTILLDDVPVPAGCFQLIGNNGYAGAQVPVSPGAHHFYAPVPFGICVYGWAEYESYAFMGGFYSESIESNTRLELTQTTPFAAAGHEKTVMARLMNGRGLPIPDLNVSFSVSGANPAAGQAVTSHFGETIFSYSGTNAGTDVITATLVNLEQSVTNTWIAGSDNAPPVVSTAGTLPLQFSLTTELVGSVSDDGRPAGANLNVRWRLLAGLGDVQFENAAQAVTRAFCSRSGRYVFEFSADDTQFSSHALVEVIVDDPPGVAIPDGYEIPSLVPVGSAISLAADAWDDDGIVERVEFYANDSLIGTATNGNSWTSYSVDWTPSTNGWFQIRAAAFDNLGGSNSLDLGTIQADFLPRVSIDSPGNGAVLTVPTNVFVHATANDPDGAVVSVSLYVNGGLLGTSDGPDAAATWFPRQPGNYTLVAVATDDLGLTTTSDEVAVTVTGDFPQVTLYPNYINPFGQAYLQLPFGVPFDLRADAWMAGPYHITNVTFYAGSIMAANDPIGSFSEPPYQFSWTYQNRGYSMIKVVAEADSGAIGEDEVRLWPYREVSLAFAEPNPNKPVAVGTPVALQLAVDDPGHIVETFDYYVNGQLLVETTNSNPVFWQPPAPGKYELSAQANDGIWTYSPTYAAPISVTANFAFLNDGVSIVSPEDGDVLYVGSPATICLAFEDPTGDFDHAEIFTNGASLGQTTNSCFDWVPQQTNDYSLTAVACDHQGNCSAPSDPVLVRVLTPPPPPEVVITSPKDGDRLAVGQETLVAVDVNDPAQAVTNLELVVDGIKVTDSLTSYMPWTPSLIGSHTLTAVAADWNGNRVTSTPVTVAVVEMHPPTVRVTSPTDGTHFTVEALPPLGAVASDSDGIVTNLTLELDGAVLGETNGAALELSATNILGGWHTVLARATDNDGLTSASATVSFFVERSEDASLPVPDRLAAEAVSATEVRLNWQPLLTNTPAGSVLVERWNTDLATWIEIGKMPVTETNYTDSNLNPETCYRYRAATTDDKVHCSAYSAEVQATTRTVVPHYSVIDLTEALVASLTGPSANILTNSGLHHFDSRRTVPLDASHADSMLGTNTTALKLAVARFKERWPQIQLDYDPILLSPKSVLPRLGYLTGPGGAGITVSDATAQLFDPADPDRPVKAFLQEYQALFGFGPEAIMNANVQRDYVSAGNGARTVVWQQQVAGVPVFNALLIAHITQDGELACLSSEFIPSPAQAADPALLAAVQSGADLPLSAPQALVTAVINVGDRFTSGYVVAQTDAAGVTRRQTFTATDGIKGNARAELTWFPAGRAQLRLCWQVLFTSPWRDEMYLTLVAADTGEVLYRRNLTAESSGATYRVYTNASPAPLLPGLSAPGTTQPSPVERSLVTLTALDDTASPDGWIADSDNETRGNNVDAHLDRNDDNVADLPRPTGSPSRVFDFPLDLTTAPANYGEAATVQLFYWDNWMHDALYQLGFTEAAGNFQTDNFGRGGLDNDAVQADAQDGLGLNDGRHANNANMSTPPDGCAPRMQMYVFDGPSPARDGSLDAQIVLHEYTHGLSTRLVGGGAGIDAIQTAGMGEGWSDFYALALLTDPAADVDGVYPMGSYAAYHGFGTTFEENYYYGIRRYPYCTDTNKNPLTFADIDPAQASAHDGVPRSPLFGPFSADTAGEVHSQGEVWCMMLWEMRANLIRKLGPETGNNLALQLVTDGLKLSPPNPNFVQARDAILLADRMWSGGTNATEIWSAFAKRGLGFNAKAPESYTTAGAQESRDLMPALAAEWVEIQNGSGAIELGADNNLLIHLSNQGDAAATHVSGHLATATAGVTVRQSFSTYSDIPQGGSCANNAVFQIQTGTGFVEGTPIDLAFAITSDQNAGTNYLRLFTGVPGAEILFDNYSALADPGTDSSVTKDLTPMDLGNAEPSWMADDASCLLKAGTGKYVLWKPDGTSYSIVNTNFLAHRLTRNGVAVGTLTVTNTFDELNDSIPHSVGAWWFFLLNQPVSLTQDEYRWPKNAAPRLPAGMAYSLTNLMDGQPAFLTNVTSYPTLQDVWDMNSNGVAVGSVSVQEPFTWQQILFGPDGTMDWFTPSERGLDAGSGTNSVTELRYFALLSTAAQFNNINNWRWLGPLSSGNSTAIALLVNNAGMIAGYGGIYTGDPTLDALRPTHAFRAPASGEFNGSAIILTNDLGVLPGGLHSFPRAMNQAGELAGYSDFDVTDTGGLTYSPYNSHAVFWGLTNQTPEYLTNLPPSGLAPYGFGDAFALNDSNQIVGASMTFDGRLVAALWQHNHNTNGASSPNSAPFWEITDLNQRLTDTNWQVFRAVGINNNSLILAHAVNAAGEKRAVLLVPMAMAVDNNRDGQINFDGSDVTSSSNPFRFWINDSQEHDDEVSIAEDQIPGQSFFKANGSLIHVNGRSDLVNYFPVALRLGNALQALPPASGYEYRLLQDDTAPPQPGNSPIKFVYTSLTPTNAFDYLTNTASFGYGTNFDEAITNADTIQVLNAPGILLDTNWLAQIQNNGGTGIILAEGCAATTQPLWLEIWRNGKLLGGVPLYLSLDGVEQMFRHLNFCAAANGSIDVAPRPTAPNEPATNGKNFMFLHGYNVNQQEARGVLSEVFKRMYWSGSKAKFYGVTWNGAVTKNLTSDFSPEWQFTPDYHTNVYNAFLTAPPLADFLGSLSGETVVAAHSLGNMVVLSALNDCTNVNFKVNGYFMIDAAVAMEAVQNMAYDPSMVFSTWRPYSNRLYASDWWQLFPAGDGRSTLTWNNRLANFRNTDIYNFYSSGEEVLRRYNVDPPAGVLRGTATEFVENQAGHPYGSYAWVWQEKGKGTSLHDNFIGSTHGGWKFSYYWRDPYGHILPPDSMNDILNSRLQEQPAFSFNSSMNGPPDEDLLGDDGSAYAQAHRDRILSDAIPALTLPVGANPVDIIGRTHNLDMQKEFESNWPSDRGPVRFGYSAAAGEWHHSDFGYIAYPFTHKLFDQIVNDGKLK